MRFVFVIPDQVGQAERLVNEAGAADVVVIPMIPGTHVPVRYAERLRESPGAEVVFVGIRPKTRGKLLREYDLRERDSVATAVGAASTFAQWFGYPPPTVRELLIASAAFANAQRTASRLLLAHEALAGADDLPRDRLLFVNQAAEALAYLANGNADPKQPSFWLSYGLKFAPSGDVLVEYEVYRAGELLDDSSTYWHLKKGDHTDDVHAPRLYFAVRYYEVDGQKKRYVLVLFLGAHPERNRVLGRVITVP